MVSNRGAKRLSKDIKTQPRSQCFLRFLYLDGFAQSRYREAEEALGTRLIKLTKTVSMSQTKMEFDKTFSQVSK